MSNYYFRKIVLTRESFSVFLTIILSTFISCSKVENDFENPPHDFEIYLLDDPNIKIEDILSLELVNQDKQALANIEIQQHPWLTDDDIRMYDFSSHLLYLKHNKYDYLPEPIQLDVPASWYDKPFMVVADGQRRYVGYFSGFYSSNLWPLPVIDNSYNFFYPEDLLIITWQWFNHDTTDSRNDFFVMESLNNAGVLHNGLNLILKKIAFQENSDTASVEYAFTIINEDTDNLYILDPDKMGSELFHHYNIGPQFVKSDELGVRTASLYKPAITSPRDTWKPEWFIKLNSGDSITRTVNLKGYPVFPPGIYQCETTFQCLKKIPKEQRTLSDGRYWVGPTKSNLIYIQY